MDTNQGLPVALNVVRFKLGADEPARQPDPLGRARVGFTKGLSTAELWERGRGVWKAKLAAVAECDLVILTHDGVVVLVATIDGVNFVGEKLAVTGVPDPKHPLIGRPDPLDNASRNPVAYGEVLTVSPDPAQRPTASVLADAIGILTEAARLRRPTLHVVETGKVEPDPYRTELADFPEFLTLALAGAAANVGGVENLLAGRRRSWEAAGVESLLDSTVGPDGADLWRHRTEPVRFTAHVPAVMALYADGWTDFYSLEDAIDLQEQHEQDRLQAAIMDEALYWLYDISTPGDPVPLSPDAPAWSWDTYRAHYPSSETTEQIVAALEDWIRSNGGSHALGTEHTRIYLPRDAAAQSTIAALEARQDEITRKYEGMRAQLAQRRLREWATYGAALRRELDKEIGTLSGLTVPVEISVDAATEQYDPGHDYYSLEWKLIERAASRVNR